MSNQDFLVELGTEELPPKTLLKLSNAFAAGIETGLKKENLAYESVSLFSTPRRLAVIVKELASKQADSKIEKLGPAIKAAFDSDGAPTKAAMGFARSVGVDVQSLDTVERDGVEKLYFSSDKPGLDTTSILPEIVKQSLTQLPIAKRMRWGSSRVEFVRPVHWCVMLFGDQVIETDLLGVRSSNVTRGHRFHYDKKIEITSPASYEALLVDTAFVIPDFSKRKEMIREQVLEKAKELGATAVIDEDLLNEVTGLVEFPVALRGKFDESFLEVPPEALILAMKSHQKYFYLVDAQEKLLPGFISVSNIESKDPEQVVAGNEKVIRPRLADARFFYETDLKQPLENSAEQLKTIVFQSKLGTVYEKSERVSALASHISSIIGANNEYCERAAFLAKCDLVSNMVGEFADLQGLMGCYYAKAAGEADEVSTAIREQYLPRFAGDDLPETKTGQVLSLAEKLDTMCGLFAIGQPPTGSKDPFAIRRAALGVLRILVEKNLDINIKVAIEFSLSLFQSIDIPENTADTVFDFILERFKSWYQDRGIKADIFQSVLSVKPSSPLDFDLRVQAVHNFSKLPEATSLAAANKRVTNLIAKSKNTDLNTDISISLLEEGAEKSLFDLLESKESEVAPLLESRDYSSYLENLATMKDAVDGYFEDVLVMADDLQLRNNRLALLSKLQKLFLRVADISSLHHGK